MEASPKNFKKSLGKNKVVKHTTERNRLLLVYAFWGSYVLFFIAPVLMQIVEGSISLNRVYLCSQPLGFFILFSGLTLLLVHPFIMFGFRYIKKENKGFIYTVGLYLAAFTLVFASIIPGWYLIATKDSGPILDQGICNSELFVASLMSFLLLTIAVVLELAYLFFSTCCCNAKVKEQFETLTTCLDNNCC